MFLVILFLIQELLNKAIKSKESAIEKGIQEHKEFLRQLGQSIADSVNDPIEIAKLLTSLAKALKIQEMSYQVQLNQHIQNKMAPLFSKIGGIFTNLLTESKVSSVHVAFINMKVQLSNSGLIKTLVDVKQSAMVDVDIHVPEVISHDQHDTGELVFRNWLNKGAFVLIFFSFLNHYKQFV